MSSFTLLLINEPGPIFRTCTSMSAVVKAACLEIRGSRVRAALWPLKCFYPAHS